MRTFLLGAVLGVASVLPAAADTLGDAQSRYVDCYLSAMADLADACEDIGAAARVVSERCRSEFDELVYASFAHFQADPTAPTARQLRKYIAGLRKGQRTLYALARERRGC